MKDIAWVGEEEAATVQNNTFNSSFALSPSQIQAANLSNTEARSVEVALNFERTNWAPVSVAEDQFYNAPSVNSSTPPGSLLKVEEYTNTSYYTIPSNVALSRILFASQTLNGSVIPASAYVLWPWQAKTFEGSSINVSGVPVVGWAHGTSGVFGECAPSHIRNLWYQFSAPFTLALQGYAVVAPDFAGLGVQTADGKPVVHQYLAHPAEANDVLYAIRAAQVAFPELSKQFVTMGHSQGGGSVWSTAVRQHKHPFEGFLGAIAASPDPDIYQLTKANPGLFRLAWRIAHGAKTIFPDFDLSEWLELEGLRRFQLFKELQGCGSVETELFPQPDDIVRSDWYENWYLRAFSNLTHPSRRPISGPMLIIQGTKDPAVLVEVLSAAVNDTCAMYPDSQINLALYDGVTHDPILDAAQQVWSQWIKDRFMGKEVGDGCSRVQYKPLRAIEDYQTELNYYLQTSLQEYMIP